MMPQRRWAYRSTKSSSSSSVELLSTSNDFSDLPYDILRKIGSNLKHPTVQAASRVCKSWNEALRPLREAMVFLKWGKRFKHGRGGVSRDLDKALHSFLNAALRGSTLAMVDAGLLYWEMGHKQEGLNWYFKAALLGDPSAQCNLAISYLHFQPPNPEEAVKWLYKASSVGHVRAQYQLALCLHQGRGTPCDLPQAAKWYLQAAQGGYVRAMYNVSLCYSVGQGFRHSATRARTWMKRAADHGHAKAHFELGLRLFSEGDMMKAVVSLELAIRAGEKSAARIKDVILLQLSATERTRAMLLADNWRALPSSS